MEILLLICIIVFLWADSYISRHDKYLFMACMIAAILLSLNDLVSDFFSPPQSLQHVKIQTILSFIGYTLRPLLLWGLWHALRGEKKKSINMCFCFLAVTNVLVFSTCFFSRLTFYYEPPTYRWMRGPLGLYSHYVMILMILLFIPTLFHMYIKNKKEDFWVGFFSLALIILSVFLDTIFKQDTITDVIVIECVLNFLFLHAKLEREYTQAMLVAQKAEMMMLQIKPHFINNTLSTIQALCEIDPVLASRTTGNFARYLRANLTSMDKPLPIPIEDEMAHTRTYLEIEMLRFPWIEAEYDLQDTDFCIPALTIQPLVENAIQHGLRKQRKGLVKISTRHTNQGHMIQIIDNGSGFDEKNPVTKEGHGVGIQNVKYRIETISQGSLFVTSNEGKGTTITIYIP